ncbi:hypothetical protein NKR23_g3228 [Pleurostoma richardsiae]|uniref:Peroxin 20 n=1 Tax=Pleurostoma richardsiae TaxID=41990 RepID=A0AA38S057_9PEZI|nr:hypothetical protein NKR23_g3228 [Pleurostoma richardsiae]
MADSCGPSNAGKGLLQHFDRNRSLQQDRVVNAAPPAANTSFRSTQNAPGADAAFHSFQSGGAVPALPGPGGLLGGVPVRSPQNRDHPVNYAPRQTPDAYRLRDADHQVPAWVQDFQRMQMGSNGPATPANGVQAGFRPAAQGTAASLQNPYYVLAESTMMVGAKYLTAPRFSAPAMGPRLSSPDQSAAGTSQDAGPAYANYPTSLLANTTEEALDAAFAAYDDDFQAEMNDWVGQHNPQLGDHGQAQAGKVSPEEVEAHKRALAAEQEQLENARVNEVIASVLDNQPREAAADKKEGEDFRRAAMDILATVSTNDSEKFKNSSFVDLMRRISNREIVLDGENLVDAATGETIGGGGDASPTAGEAAKDGNEAEGSGKGKERAEN